MILPLKVALCLGFNLPEVSENNQTKLLKNFNFQSQVAEKNQTMWNK